METRTAIWEASHGAGVAPALCTEHKTACALLLLRRPTCATGVLALGLTFFVMAFLRFGWTPRLWYSVPLLIALAVIVVLDIRAKVIPDVVTLPGILYVLIVGALMDRLSFSSAILGAVTGGGIVFLVAVISRGAIGGGDIKLMAMLGTALGWKGALVVLALSQVSAALIVLGLLIGGRLGRRDALPVGAIMSFLGAVMLLGGP